MQKTLDKPKKKDYSLYNISNVLTGTPDLLLLAESRRVVRGGKRTDPMGHHPRTGLPNSSLLSKHGRPPLTGHAL